MNVKQALLLLVVTTGCSPDFAYDCTVPWGSYTSETPVNCDKVAEIFSAARDFLTTDGSYALSVRLPGHSFSKLSEIEKILPNYNRQVISYPEFQKKFGNINVHEVKEYSYKVLGTEVWGNYDIFSGIQVANGRLCVLTHELTHGIEASKLDLSTSSHKDWDEKGHTEKTIAFMWYLDYRFEDASNYHEQQEIQ